MKKNDRKREIIKATTEIIKEEGLQGATMRKIAAKANVTTGSLYHHYSNKEEIFRDIISDSLTFSHLLVQNIDEGIKGEALLRNLIDGTRQRLNRSDKQTLNLLLIGQAISRGGGEKELHGKSHVEIIEHLSSVFAGHRNQSENDKKNLVMASLIVAAMDGIAIQQALNTLPCDQHDFVDIASDIFHEILENFLSN